MNSRFHNPQPNLFDNSYFNFNFLKKSLDEIGQRMVKGVIKDYFREDTTLNLLIFEVLIHSSRICWIVMSNKSNLILKQFWKKVEVIGIYL